RRRISPSLSEVAAAVAVRNSLKMNSITYLAAKGSQPRRGGWWRLWRAVEVGGGRSMTSTIVHQPPLTSPSWHRPRKHDVGSERLKQLRTHPRHTVEPRQPAERTVLLAPRDDPLRERGPDSRETRDLRHVGAVEVDALTGEQRPRQPGGGPGRGGEPSRRRVYGHQPHVAGRRGRGGGEGQTHTRAGER